MSTVSSTSYATMPAQAYVSKGDGPTDDTSAYLTEVFAKAAKQIPSDGPPAKQVPDYGPSVKGGKAGVLELSGPPQKVVQQKVAQRGWTHQYTVRPGDSLSTIAARYGMEWEQLYDANRDQISNPRLIHPGQVLRIASGQHCGMAPGTTPSQKKGTSSDTAPDQVSDSDRERRRPPVGPSRREGDAPPGTPTGALPEAPPVPDTDGLPPALPADFA